MTFVNEGWLRFTGRTCRTSSATRSGPAPTPTTATTCWCAGASAFARRTEFRFEYRLMHRDGEHRWVLEVGHAALRRGRVRRLRRHRHRHPRAQADGGRAAQVRGELPRPRRQRAGDDLDDRRARAGDLRQRGLAGLHRHDARGGAGPDAGRSACIPRTPPRWWRRGRGARPARSCGSASTACARQDGEYRWIAERGVPRYEGGRFVGYVGTAIDIHERKTMEGAAARGLRARAHDRRDAPAQPAARAPAADRGARDRGPLPAGRAREPRSAATGTTRSSAPTGGWPWWWATWSATGCAPPRRWASCATPSAPTGWPRARPAEVMARVNRLVMSGEEDADGHRRSTWCSTARPARSASRAPATRRRCVLGADGAALPRGRPLGADRRRGLGRVPRGDRGAARGTPRCCSTPTAWSSAATSRSSDRLDALAEAADRAEGGLEGLCDAVLAGVLGQRMPNDDVALLAVRPRPVASEAIRFTLPGRAGVAAPGCAAGWRASCTRPARTTLEAYEITLTICEAAGNAIEHAYGPGDATFEVEARARRRRAGGHRAATGALARAPRHAPRTWAEHHRGPDGPGGGLDRARRHGGAHAQAAGRERVA